MFPLRHSAEHVMHLAVESLFLELKSHGTSNRKWFYGDFDYDGK